MGCKARRGREQIDQAKRDATCRNENENWKLSTNEPRNWFDGVANRQRFVAIVPVKPHAVLPVQIQRSVHTTPKYRELLPNSSRAITTHTALPGGPPTADAISPAS